MPECSWRFSPIKRLAPVNANRLILLFQTSLPTTTKTHFSRTFKSATTASTTQSKRNLSCSIRGERERERARARKRARESIEGEKKNAEQVSYFLSFLQGASTKEKRVTQSIMSTPIRMMTRTKNARRKKKKSTRGDDREREREKLAERCAATMINSVYQIRTIRSVGWCW